MLKQRLEEKELKYRKKKKAFRISARYSFGNGIP